MCRRWRNVVFGSPRRLNLLLYCTNKTPIKDRLDVWPDFPLVVSESFSNIDNIIAAIGQSNRVRQVEFVPFGFVIKIRRSLGTDAFDISGVDRSAALPYMMTHHPAIPDMFLGGSAPRLQIFWLESVSFPGLPLPFSPLSIVNYTMPCSMIRSKRCPKEYVDAAVEQSYCIYIQSIARKGLLHLARQT